MDDVAAFNATPLHLILDTCALLGAAVLVIVLVSQARLRAEKFMLRTGAVVAILMALRIANTRWGGPVVSVMIELVVATLPVLALMTAESLMRQHAPKWLKVTCLFAGGLTLALIAMTPVLDNGTRTSAIGIGLITALLCVLYFVVRRDPRSLMLIENQRIRSLLFALAVAVPFAATDFLSTHDGSVMRLGAIGAACLVLGCVRVATGLTSPFGYGVDLLIAIAISVSGVAIISHLTPLDQNAQYTVAASLASLGLVIVMMVHLQRFVRERLRPSFALHLARARTSSIDAFHRDIRKHDLVRESRVVDGVELDDIASPEAIGYLTKNPVASRLQLERWSNLRRLSTAEEATLSVLKSTAMSHAALLSATPPKLLLCESIGANGDKDESANLVLLARTAAMIEGREHHA